MTLNSEKIKFTENNFGKLRMIIITELIIVDNTFIWV